MTELYVGARDGYISGEALIGRVKSRGHVPSYARAVTAPKKGLSGKDLWDAVDAVTARLVH